MGTSPYTAYCQGWNDCADDTMETLVDLLNGYVDEWQGLGNGPAELVDVVEQLAEGFDSQLVWYEDGYYALEDRNEED